MDWFIGLVVVLLSCGGVSALFASARGHNPILWYILGSLLGPFTVARTLTLERVDRTGQRQGS